MTSKQNSMLCETFFTHSVIVPDFENVFVHRQNEILAFVESDALDGQLVVVILHQQRFVWSNVVQEDLKVQEKNWSTIIIIVWNAMCSNLSQTCPVEVPTARCNPSRYFKEVTPGITDLKIEWNTWCEYGVDIHNVPQQTSSLLSNLFNDVRGTVEFSHTFFRPRIPTLDMTLQTKH